MYRLCISKNFKILNSAFQNPTLAAFSEINYSWIISPTFDIYKAKEVCELLSKKPYNMASFYKQSVGERRKNKCAKNTNRYFYYLNIEPGNFFKFFWNFSKTLMKFFK